MMRSGLTVLLLALANDGAGAPTIAPLPAEAAFTRAENLMTGTGGRFDPVAAERLFREAAAAGNVLAQYELALNYVVGMKGFPKDKVRADQLAEASRPAVEARSAAGDAIATNLLGLARSRGLGCRVDAKEARRLYQEAADRGLGIAMNNLGVLAETGEGVERPDQAQAESWYRRAIAAGVGAMAEANLARVLAVDGSPAERCVEARRLFEKAAATGYPNAAAGLGHLLLYGRAGCSAVDVAAALPWLEKAAEGGQSGASYNVALALLSGEAGKRDDGRALELLARASEAKEGYSIELLYVVKVSGLAGTRDAIGARRLIELDAQLGDLGLPYLRTYGRNARVLDGIIVRARERLEPLAKAGDPSAQSLLGFMLTSSIGGDGDEARGRELLHQAAEGGDPEAMRGWAEDLMTGRGVERDVAAAMSWYERCAAAGGSFCMRFYGDHYLEGDVVERDLRKGLEWVTRAADAGNYWAIDDLSKIYGYGQYGVARDLAKAAPWMRKAAAAGSAEARGWLLANGFPVE